MRDSDEIFEGKVAFFNCTAGKRYGFIRVEGWKDDIFFHFNDGIQFVADEGEVRYLEKTPVYDPRPGDEIMFQVHIGKTGRPTASPWGFVEDYDALASQMRSDRVYYELPDNATAH